MTAKQGRPVRIPEGGLFIKRETGKPDYWQIKHNGKLIYLHRYLWQQEYGEIPPGHLIAFKNGNPADCRLANLECITKAESIKRNVNRKKAGETIKRIRLTVSIMEANRLRHRYGYKSKYSKPKNAA